MSTATDLERAITNAWDELADGEGEHNQALAAHAVEDLVRLRQLGPESHTRAL